MSDRNDSSAFSPTLSHKAAVPLFIVVLVGFVAETQLTQVCHYISLLSSILPF